jgi:hypothetical protein
LRRDIFVRKSNDDFESGGYCRGPQGLLSFCGFIFPFCSRFKKRARPGAKELIEKAIRNRAVDRGEKLKNEADCRQLPATMENWPKVTDIPFLGWDKSLGKLECPYAEAWLARYDDNPWFAEIAQLYCNVNDPQVSETFTGNISQRITKNVLAGDEVCDREYFQLEKK